jgi:transcriptional regulator with XRE-family HTH domain
MSSNNRDKLGRPPTEPQRPLCKRIRERRNKLRLSVDQCVAKSGIGRSDWYRYETTTTPDAFAIRDIARTLKTTVEDLLRGLDD